MPIRIEKHCRLHPEPEDGFRVLVMRFWPRGVRKDKFDVWMRDLAPSPELLRSIMSHEGRATDAVWQDWSFCYQDEMALQSSAIEQLRARHKAGDTITLLCGCHDKTRCHRGILRDLIMNGEDK